MEYPNEDKKILNKVLKNSTLENTMRDHASEMYQYEAINRNRENRNAFRKRLECEQITVGNQYAPDTVHVWYRHPDDSGAWYMTVDTKNNKILDEQYYR